jgi:hypothetical protein
LEGGQGLAVVVLWEFEDERSKVVRVEKEHWEIVILL